MLGLNLRLGFIVILRFRKMLRLMLVVEVGIWLRFELTVIGARVKGCLNPKYNL